MLYSCTHMATVGVKVLTVAVLIVVVVLSVVGLYAADAGADRLYRRVFPVGDESP